MKLKHLFYLSFIVIIAACNSNDKPVAQIAVAPLKKLSSLEEPFKFHKMLEVAPGNYYDVFSWGRGTKDGAKYVILRSDSADQQYNSVEGDLEGPVQDVFNTDLDTDGNPEIIIYAKSIDTNRYVNVFVYEYQNRNARRLDFPRLTETQRKGYRGGDHFYVKDNKLIREFPIYNGKGKEATPSGQKRMLQYSLNSNNLSAKQVSTDPPSTNTTLAETKPAQTHKAAAPKKHKTITRKKAKKHTVKKRHKHRR